MHRSCTAMAIWVFFSCCLLMVTSGQTIEVPAGDKAVLQCNGSGYGDAFTTEPKSITWKTQDHKVVEYNATEVRIDSGFEGRVQVDIMKFQEGDFTLTLYPTHYNDGDMYECVSNTDGTDQTFLGSVHLKVLAPAVPVPLPVMVGQSVTLPCYAHMYRHKSQDTISLQWKKGQQEVLVMKSGEVTYGSEQRNRSSVPLNWIRKGNLSLTLKNVRFADEGVYSCSYEQNDHLEDGDPAGVPLVVTAYTANRSLSLGETLHLPLFTVNPVRVQFSKAGSGHPVILCSIHNDQAQWSTNCRRKASVQNSTLLLDSITSADEGQYTVQDIQTNQTTVSVSLSVTEGDPKSRSQLSLPVTTLIVCMVVCVVLL